MLNLVNYQDKMLDAYNKNVEAMPTEFTFFNDSSQTVHTGFLTYKGLNAEFDDVVLTTTTKIKRGDVIVIDGLRFLCISHVLFKRYGVYYEAVLRHSAYKISFSYAGSYIVDRKVITVNDLLGSIDTEAGYIYGTNSSTSSFSTALICSTRTGYLYETLVGDSDSVVEKFKKLQQQDPEHYYCKAVEGISYILGALTLYFLPLNEDDKFPGMSFEPFAQNSGGLENIREIVPDYTKEGLVIMKLSV